MGALCLSATFVSCIDDEESAEVTAMRKAQVDNTYIAMYTNALGEIKSLEADLATAQSQLNNLKDGKATTEESADIVIKYLEKEIEIANTERLVHASHNGSDYLTLSDYGNDTFRYNEYKNGRDEYWDNYVNNLQRQIDLAKDNYNDDVYMINALEKIIAEIEKEIAFQQKIADRAYEYFGFKSTSSAE